MRLSVFTLLFALVTAFHTVIPTQAEAASALFRVKRSWIGGGATTANGGTASPYISPYYHPPMKGPNKAPPAQGIISHDLSYVQFSVPSKVIKNYTGTRACPTFMDCRPGYPVSETVLSYHNVKGIFQPNNPYGATTTVSVYFPTTGNGAPTSPTTTFNGNYDFSRSGSIMITPGTNHFGGTLKFFYGPNHLFTSSITLSTPYVTRGFAAACPPDCSISPTSEHPSMVQVGVIGRRMTFYRYTPSGYSKLTTGPPDYHYYRRDLQRVSTVAPWTTGTINPWVGHTTSTHGATGYDNRTPNGLSGVISLVRPRLVHSYVVPHDPNLPIVKARSFAEIWQMDIHFTGAAPDFDSDGVGDAIDNCSEAANADQDDTDGDGCGNLCDADYDNTGQVGFADFGEFATAFGTGDMEKCHIEPIPGCTVGYAEFGFFEPNYGSIPGPSGTTAGTTACP